MDMVVKCLSLLTPLGQDVVVHGLLTRLSASKAKKTVELGGKDWVEALATMVGKICKRGTEFTVPLPAILQYVANR